MTDVKFAPDLKLTTAQGAEVLVGSHPSTPFVAWMLLRSPDGDEHGITLRTAEARQVAAALQDATDPDDDHFLCAICGEIGQIADEVLDVEGPAHRGHYEPDDLPGDTE